MTECKVTIQRTIALPILIFCWLFFFLLPVLLFDFTLTRLFDLTRQAGGRAAVGALINEMNRFRNDTDVTHWLDKQLAIFFAVNENKIKTLSASDFDDFFTANTGIEAFATIVHKADTTDVDARVDERIAGGNLPVTYTRRFLAGLNRQADYQFYSADEQRRVAFFIRTSGSEERFYQQKMIYLRTQFAVMTDPPLIEKKAIKAISGRVAANVYFYYWPIRSSNDHGTFIDAGVFLALKTPDLRTVFADALQKASSGFERSFTHATESLPDTWPGGPPIETLNRRLTRFYEDNAGTHLVSTFSQVGAVDLIQRGGFYPFYLDKVLKRMPLLRVTVPIARLEHPLQRYRSQIRLSGLVFVLLGLIFALNSCLFGVDFKLGIRQKVLLGVAVMLIFPVMTLFAGYITWTEFSRLQAEYGERDQLSKYLEEVQAEFDSFQVEIQTDMLLLGKKLSKARAAGATDVELKAIMKVWISKSFAEAVYLERKEVVLEEFADTNINEVDEEDWFRRAISKSIFNLISRESVFAVIKTDDDRDIDAGVDPGLVSEIITSWGRLMVYERFGGDKRYGTVNIDPEHGALNAFVSAKYSSAGVVRGFVRQLYERREELDYFDRLEFYAIESGPDGNSYYKIDISESAEGQVTRQFVTDADLQWNLESAAEGNSFSWRDENGNFKSVKAFADFPLIAVARRSSDSPGLLKFEGLSMIILYAVVLAIFTMMVFGLVYLAPIYELIRVMKEIAVGNYSETIAIGSHDEFAKLGAAFNDMIVGVRQREQLARFVSEDVIEAVESESDDGIAPGGVKVDASIVFFELCDLQQLTKNDSVEAVLQLLGDFIARADRTAATHGGVLDKVIESTLMLVFRSRADLADHALAASSAALELAEEIKNAGYRLKAGIASGRVVSGRIGSRRGKLDYTVIGDTVNLAARLKVEAADTSNTGIVIAPATIRMLKGQAKLSFIKRTEIKGKSRAYPIYELLALREPRRAE